MQALLIRALTWAITFGLGDFLKALGLGLVTFVGLDLLFDQVFNILQSNINGITPDILAVLQLMGFSTGISMYMSAIATVIAFKVMTRTVKLSSKGTMQA